MLGADAEPDDVLVVDGGGDHVQLARLVDSGEELLVQLVGATKAEANKADLSI